MISEKREINRDNSQATGDDGQHFYSWIIFGFLFPIIGLITSIIWRGQKPQNNRAIRIGMSLNSVSLMLILIIKKVLGG
jgi:hypothetical protein